MRKFILFLVLLLWQVSIPLKTDAELTKKQLSGEDDIKQFLIEYARVYDVDYRRVLYVVACESRFDPKAKGPEKNGYISRGLWQLHSYYMRDVIDADAYDAIKSTIVALPRFKAHPEWWSCWRFRNRPPYKNLWNYYQNLKLESASSSKPKRRISMQEVRTSNGLTTEIVSAILARAWEGWLD